jgi:hypothetical protein
MGAYKSGHRHSNTSFLFCMNICSAHITETCSHRTISQQTSQCASCNLITTLVVATLTHLLTANVRRTVKANTAQ